MSVSMRHEMEPAIAQTTRRDILLGLAAAAIECGLLWFVLAVLDSHARSVAPPWTQVRVSTMGGLGAGTNALMIVLGVGLFLAWKTAGW